MTLIIDTTRYEILYRDPPATDRPESPLPPADPLPDTGLRIQEREHRQPELPPWLEPETDLDDLIDRIERRH